MGMRQQDLFHEALLEETESHLTLGPQALGGVPEELQWMAGGSITTKNLYQFVKQAIYMHTRILRKKVVSLERRLGVEQGIIETMEDTYTREEREQILNKMRSASGVFYSLAVQTRCHQFIEFTGLINEYIKLCEEAHSDGIDFTQANIHSGQGLPIRDHHISYLGEKLGCIYGPALDEEKAAKLLHAITGKYALLSG